MRTAQVKNEPSKPLMHTAQVKNKTSKPLMRTAQVLFVNQI